MPRYAGASTFVRLPELRDVARCDVAIVGAPFDGGVSFRPGARFGPMAVRQASRALRPAYHPQFNVQPFAVMQVADAGDIACNPYSIADSLASIEQRVGELLGPAEGPHPVGSVITIGGDHTISYALLKAVHRRSVISPERDDQVDTAAAQALIAAVARQTLGANAVRSVEILSVSSLRQGRNARS